MANDLPVDIKLITADTLEQLLQRTIRWSGYGYDKVLYTQDEVDGDEGIYWVILGDEYIKLEPDHISYIYDYYETGSDPCHMGPRIQVGDRWVEFNNKGYI